MEKRQVLTWKRKKKGSSMKKVLLSLVLMGGLQVGSLVSIKKEETISSRFDINVGAVDHWNVERILKEFKDAEIKNEKDKLIELAINSGGGSVHIGLEFIEEMKALQAKGYKFDCYVRNAYSMGFVILQYCDKRIASDHSTFMHHLTQTGMGRPKRNEKNKKLFKALDFFDNLLLEDIAKRLKLKPKEWFAIIKDDSWWNAKDALKKHMIDEIRPFSLTKKEVKYKIKWLD